MARAEISMAESATRTQGERGVGGVAFQKERAAKALRWEQEDMVLFKAQETWLVAWVTVNGG